MKLSVNIIWAALKERYPDSVLQTTGKADNDLILTCPHYIKERFALQTNRIYVVSEAQVPDDCTGSGPCLLVVPALRSGVKLGKQVSVITVPGRDAVELYNQVLTIFDRYTEWDDTLQELVFSNAPLEEFLKCSFPLIGNSMSAHNNDFSYLARVREYAPEGDFVDPELLFKADLQSDQSVFFAKDVIHYWDDAAGQEYFLLNLFNGNTVAGRLVVVSDHHPFELHDASLVRHLGRYMEATLTYTAFSGTGKDMRRDSLMELLEGKQHTEDQMMRLQVVSPWAKRNEDQSMYCLVGACRDSELTQRYIAYQLERAIPDAVSVLFDSKIVVLCGNQPRQTEEAFFEEVSAVLERWSVTAGCSNPFANLLDLIYHYRQAEFVLRRVKSDPKCRGLHHFRAHTVEHFMQFGCSVLPMRLICAPCIMRLAEHDKTAAVSYCDSLREYLDAGMNSAETARRLNIRRNTFLARLERILRYVDVDLNNEDNRLYLQLSLRLIRT